MVGSFRFAALYVLTITSLTVAADPTVTKWELPAKSVVPCVRWADAKGTEAWVLDGDGGVLLKVTTATGKVAKGRLREGDR